MAGVSVEDIQEEFADLDMDITDDEILLKLKDFCDQYNIDANKLSCEYFSFNTINKNASGKAPDMETLGQFEHEKLRHWKGPRRPLDPIEGVENLPDCAEVGTPTRMTAAAKRMITPESQVNKRFVTALGSPAVSSPSSQLYTGSQSCKYSERKNRGEIVLSHNKDLEGDWTPSASPAEVCLPKSGLQTGYKYMFESMRGRAAVLDETICRIGDILAVKYDFAEPMDIRLTQVEPQVAVGRICCDSEGHLNSNSVVLQSSMDASGGHTLPLDLSKIDSYSFFPGQIVGVECTNPNGSRLLVNKLLPDVPLPPPEPVKEDQVVQLLIASGPYTPNDTDNTQPLKDVLDAIKEKTPHVAFLIGPFVDMKNRAIDYRSRSHQQMFKDMMKEVYATVENIRTKVVLVPALRDAHEEFVYPQPPYTIVDSKLFNNKIMSISDPGMIEVSGIKIGVTSSDILFHLGKEEISYPSRSGDRLSRLVSHLMSQRSFYPLYPPNIEQNVDFEHQEEYGLLMTSPHLLILPSDLVYFTRELDSCTVVNPGRVTKGASAGTYSNIFVKSHNGTVSVKGDIVRI